ncbi:MAG TPA: ABC transporter permease [Ruminococcus flavefaciens]|nr:ABC transporter permease [Ruminococcus flavefaciens]HQM02381.1 ABC transporter permease [Ruminococcus flavefaciens]
MQIFKVFMKVLKKRLRYAMLYVGIFLGIVIPMSLNSSGSGSTKEMFVKESKSHIGICIFDEDDTPESREFADYLAEKYTIKELKNDEEVVMDSLFYMSVDRVISINKGFADRLAKGETEGIIDSRHMHESYNSMLLEQDINSYFSSVSAYIAGGEDALSASEKAKEALSAEADVKVISFTDEGNADYPRDFAEYYRYMAYVLIAAVIGTLCPVLMAMNKKEIRFRTNCSSLDSSSYTKQVLLGSAVFVIGVWLIFVIAGMILYGGVYKGRAWLAVLNSFIYAMVAGSITVFLSVFVNNLDIVNFINQAVSLGMSFMCGVFVEQELLGAGVLSAARFMPAFWYIKANMILNGTEAFDSTKLMQYMLIEAAFAVVMALLTMVVSKARYNSTALQKRTSPAVNNG